MLEECRQYKDSLLSLSSLWRVLFNGPMVTSANAVPVEMKRTIARAINLYFRGMAASLFGNTGS